MSLRTVCLRGPLIPLHCSGAHAQTGSDSAEVVAAEPNDGGIALLLLLLSARARDSCAGGVCPSRVWEGRRAEACWGGVCVGRLAVLGVHPALCDLNQTGGHFEPQALKTPSHACCAAGWSYGGRQAAVYGAGLLQVGGFRRHAKLHRAWRGTAVSRGGLCKVSCRRHRLLQGAWWRTTVSNGGLYHGSSR